MQCHFHQFAIIIGIICFSGILYFYYSNYNFDFVTDATSTAVKIYKNHHKTTIKISTTESLSVTSKMPTTTRMPLLFTATTTTAISTNIDKLSQNESDKEANENEKNEILLKINKESLELKKKKGDERKHLFQSKFFGSFYGIIAAEAECPNLVRVGKLGDGGKWICNPFVLLKLQRPCVFYSLGLNNEISFDVELMAITENQCKHIAVDMNEQRPDIIQSLPNTNFLKGKISKNANETLEEYTLYDLMAKYNNSKIDIMKMDIEGSEYDVLDQLIKIEICQILVELHSSNNNYRIFYQWLNAMSKAGFYLLHFEINEGTLKACEFTLIHKSCIKDYGITVIKQFLS